MSTIEIRKVTKQFGAFTAVKDADLKVEAGEVVCLLGFHQRPPQGPDGGRRTSGREGKRSACDDVNRPRSPQPPAKLPRAVSSAVLRGRRIVNVEPFPGPGESASISPPCLRAMARAMVRPIPLPPGPVGSPR